MGIVRSVRKDARLVQYTAPDLPQEAAAERVPVYTEFVEQPRVERMLRDDAKKREDRAAKKRELEAEREAKELAECVYFRRSPKEGSVPAWRLAQKLHEEAEEKEASLAAARQRQREQEVEGLFTPNGKGTKVITPPSSDRLYRDGVARRSERDQKLREAKQRQEQEYDEKHTHRRFHSGIKRQNRSTADRSEARQDFLSRQAELQAKRRADRERLLEEQSEGLTFTPKINKKTRRRTSSPRTPDPNGAAAARTVAPASPRVVQEAIDRLCSGLGSKAAARQTFREIDKDSSGSLDEREFKLALKRLHLHLDGKQVALVVNHLDKDKDGLISIDEFLGVVFENKVKRVMKKLRALSYSSGGEDWDKLFRHYDRDNSGDLDYEEFRRAIRKDVGLDATMMTDEEVREMFDTLDSSGDGKIDLTEFRTAVAAPAEVEQASLDRQHSRSGKILHRLLEHADKRHTSLMTIFHGLDRDGSGTLDRQEIQQAMSKIGMALDKKDVRELMDELDQDGDGHISTKEFADRLRLARKDMRDAAEQAEDSAQAWASQYGEPEPEPEPEPESEPAPAQDPEPEPEQRTRKKKNKRKKPSAGSTASGPESGQGQVQGQDDEQEERDLEVLYSRSVAYRAMPEASEDEGHDQARAEAAVEEVDEEDDFLAQARRAAALSRRNLEKQEVETKPQPSQTAARRLFAGPSSKRSNPRHPSGKARRS